MSLDRTSEGSRLETQAALRPKLSVPAALLDFTRRKPLGAAGAVVLIIFVLVAIFSQWLAPYPPDQIGVAPKFSGPGGDGFVSVITPKSPIGRALQGSHAGDSFEIVSKRREREWTVVDVC